ncbi:MAG: glycoside hydrolase family 2 protein [Planctomycetota bacterium]|jgi:beta-galactosidase/beta-glucuronidase
MREEIDITGTWKFHVDAHDEGEQGGYPSARHDAGRWREVTVPCCFEDCARGLDFYEGAGWFRRLVLVPDEWRGRRVVIRFEGANYHTKLWVNGHLVGGNDCGFLRFEVPIYQWLRCGGENLIVVRVDGERRWGELPGAGNSIGWRSYTGILRELALEASDLLRLAHIRINAVPGGKFSLQASVANDRPEAAPAKLRLRVADSGGRTLAELFSDEVTVAAGSASELGVLGDVGGTEAWSPEHPVLYTATAELVSARQAVDRRATGFGFRQIEAKGGKLLLNGRPIFLTGFNRHEDSPRAGMCTDLETVREDILQMKAAGANFVRLCHYPHHPGEIDLCDELGLLVMGEIPLYWWSDEAERQHGTAEKKLQSAREQLRRMILRDVNHPSVIFWSVSNETAEGQREVVEGNNALIRLAKELDPTRLAVHVSNKGINAEHSHFELDDVICVNGYASYWGGRDRERPEEARRYWAEHLAALYAKYPGKPILVSEFGHPCIEGEFGGTWGEDTAARAINAEFEGMTAPYVCGATIWCYADHPWPKFDHLRGVTVSPFGLVSRNRKKLEPYHAAKKMFADRRARAADS